MCSFLGAISLSSVLCHYRFQGGAIELQCFVHIFDKISCNTKVVFNHFDRDSHEYRQSLYIACKTQQKWGCTSSRNSSTLGISQSFSANPIAVPSIHGYSTTPPVRLLIHRPFIPPFSAHLVPGFPIEVLIDTAGAGSHGPLCYDNFGAVEAATKDRLPGQVEVKTKNTKKWRI